MVSAQLSSTMKKTEVYTFQGDSFANQGRSDAPISRWRIFTMKVVRMIVVTGKGLAVHRDSATNWDAPAYTRPLMSNASKTLNFAWRASTPKTIPIANPLIAKGIVRFAPSSAPLKVNVIFSLVVLSLSLTFAFCTVMNLVIVSFLLGHVGRRKRPHPSSTPRPPLRDLCLT